MAGSKNDHLATNAQVRPPRKKRFKGLLLGLAITAFVILLPRLLTSRPVLSVIIDRFAGLDPLQVTLTEVQAGWLTPVRAAGIEVTSEHGTRLARIGTVETEKGLLGWIWNSSDLGKVTIRNLEAAAEAANGTTNVELSLAHLISTSQNEPSQPSTGTTSHLTGVVELVDCKLMVSEAGRPERWVVVIPTASVDLPSPEQFTGAIQLQATMTEISGTVTNSTGSLSASLVPSDAGGFQFHAAVDSLPSEVWHVVKARLPELPVEQLAGRLSGVARGDFVSDTSWNLSLQDLAVSGLTMVSPQLVGEAPLNLQSITGFTNCSLDQSVLQVVDARLVCDFAQATVRASLPWPAQSAGTLEPFVPGATIHAEGNINLPGLVTAAASLIPMRENTQLVGGDAQFVLDQQLSEDAQPFSRLSLQLSGLRALAGSQEIVWQEPLTLAVAANKAAGQIALQADASAEFAKLKIGGNTAAGTLGGKVDLSLLHQRLSQWIELPVDDMQGTVDLDLQWMSQDNQVVEARGQLNTTALALSTNTGGTLDEPAWKGDFACRLDIANGSPQALRNASLQLESPAERLSFDLHEPLYLSTTQGEPVSAAFTVDLRTDLANCARRGDVWLSEPMDMNLSGKLQLAVSGSVGLSRLEVNSANWSCEPLVVTTPQLTLSEPKVIGKFGGRIDTADLTRLVVDVLQVQSTSFSVGAKDQAKAGDQQSRVGQAMWRADLARLLRNVGTEVSAGESPSPTSAPAKLSATGTLQGQLAWEVSPQAAGFNTRVDGQDIQLLSQAASDSAPSPLWQEPSAVASLAGTWKATDGSFDIQMFQIQLPWLNYDGQLAYSSQETGQAVQMTGQLAYDAAQLSTKLVPYTGEQIRLSGQQAVPLELTWNSVANQELSSLSGLNASTRLGWEQASVAGIPVGKAEVPIQIESGRLRSAAEIPVSGGAMRWDFDSDLAADELVFQQKPMLVLDNVQITDQMCQGWLKYVAPLVAKTTSVDGRLSLQLEQALLNPSLPSKQSAKGQVIIHNATVGPGPLSNQIIFIANQLEAIRKQQFGRTVGSTQKVWLDMPEQRIDFHMVDGKVIHQNLNVKMGDATLTTAGSVDLNGMMDIQASVPIPDDWAEKSPWLAGLKGQALQFPIRGSLSNPQIDSQPLTQLGTQTVQHAADGLIRQQLNRGLDKLLGGQDNTNGDGTNANANPNPLQDIGGQILKGQGLNLPGLFPGFGGRQAPPAK